MNKHTRLVPATSPIVPANTGEVATPIGAAAKVVAGQCPTGEAGAPNLSNPFRFRTELCPDCDRATTIRCDNCWSSGETDAACCVCNRVTALDDDGYCRACLEPSDGSSWLRAETSALNMGRAR